jgi:hypothetical protein
MTAKVTASDPGQSWADHDNAVASKQIWQFRWQHGPERFGVRSWLATLCVSRKKELHAERMLKES